jgi:EmrB/QacA subfamily drug resistance transporter
MEPPGRLAPPAADRLDRRAIVVAGVVVLGMLMALLDTTIVNVALERLADDFSVSFDAVQWVVTAYLLALACVIPLTGWATGRFGTKRVWLWAVGLFAGGSALCACAWSLGSLVAFRALQGLGGGLLIPVGTLLITRAAGPGRLGRLMGIVGVPMLLGPVLGPVLGGAIVEHASWRWIFLVNLPVGAAALWLAARTLDETDEQRVPLDVRGLVLLSPGLALLTYGLAELSRSGAVAAGSVLPLAAAIVLTVAFCVHARRTEHPLVDLGLFRSRTFSAAAVAIFLVGAALFGGLLLLPLYYQVARGESPLHAGVLLAPQGIGAALAMPISGRLTDRVGGGRVAIFGLAIVAAATAVFTQLGPETSIGLLSGTLVVRGVGMACSMIPLMTAAYATLPRNALASAATALNVVQRVGGSLGTAILAVILQHQITTAGSAPRALAGAFSTTFAWALALTLIALPAALLLARRPAAARDSAAPRLLVAFSAATLAMVGAIVLMARADSDWADAGGVAAMLAAATVVLVEIMRALRDEGEPSDPPTPPAGPRLAP